ncbi:hypothetical protein GGR56DRAFT_388209 [Xylariaceae sp. FL0804]|nr:hypothetical protein GGR56DRAFT_388209 [Xylariaceae sp. FL0804]
MPSSGSHQRPGSSPQTGRRGGAISSSSSGLALTREVTEFAFRVLDEEIGKSELLVSVAPLRCITVGGSLAVMLCGNRESTMDVDVMLDPNIRQADEYWAGFKSAIRQTGKHIGAGDKWMNEDLQIFVAREKREDLFLRSVESNILIYAGENVVIYAGDLYWALERKLRRVTYSAERGSTGKAVDLPDAAALIHQIRGGMGNPPLSMREIQQYNLNSFDLAPDDQSLRRVARLYYDTYGEDGMVEYVWHEELQGWKWQDQMGGWHLT